MILRPFLLHLSILSLLPLAHSQLTTIAAYSSFGACGQDCIQSALNDGVSRFTCSASSVIASCVCAPEASMLVYDNIVSCVNWFCTPSSTSIATQIFQSYCAGDVFPGAQAQVVTQTETQVEESIASSIAPATAISSATPSETASSSAFVIQMSSVTLSETASLSASSTGMSSTSVTRTNSAFLTETSSNTVSGVSSTSIIGMSSSSASWVSTTSMTGTSGSSMTGISIITQPRPQATTTLLSLTQQSHPQPTNSIDSGSNPGSSSCCSTDQKIIIALPIVAALAGIAAVLSVYFNRKRKRGVQGQNSSATVAEALQAELPVDEKAVELPAKRAAVTELPASHAVIAEMPTETGET